MKLVYVAWTLAILAAIPETQSAPAGSKVTVRTTKSARKATTPSSRTTPKATTTSHHVLATAPGFLPAGPRHVAQLKILRDSKIKQNRQWAEGQPCPSGWLHFNDSCYWGSTYQLSWFAAEHECRNFGYDAHLASVHGADENMRVQAMAGCGAPWIGLTKTDPTKTSDPMGSWAWTDTSPNDYLSWRIGNPLGVDERNCAYQDKGTAAAGGSGWANAYCTELRVFTCKADAKVNSEGGGEEPEGEGEAERPEGANAAGEAEGEGGTGNKVERHRDNAKMTTKKPPAQKATTKPNTGSKTPAKAREEEPGAVRQPLPNSESPIPCRGGAGWLDGKNGFCYFYSSSKANWYTAEATCRNHSASVITVKTELEHRLAMLGGCDKRVWLGAVRYQPEEKWHWYNDMTALGENGAFTNWAQNNTGANYVVAYMDTTGNGGGRWYDSPNVHEQMHYICKQPIADEEENGAEEGGAERETTAAVHSGEGATSEHENEPAEKPSESEGASEPKATTPAESESENNKTEEPEAEAAEETEAGTRQVRASTKAEEEAAATEKEEGSTKEAEEGEATEANDENSKTTEASGSAAGETEEEENTPKETEAEGETEGASTKSSSTPEPENDSVPKEETEATEEQSAKETTGESETEGTEPTEGEETTPSEEATEKSDGEGKDDETSPKSSGGGTIAGESPKPSGNSTAANAADGLLKPENHTVGSSTNTSANAIMIAPAVRESLIKIIDTNVTKESNPPSEKSIINATSPGNENGHSVSTNGTLVGVVTNQAGTGNETEIPLVVRKQA